MKKLLFLTIVLSSLESCVNHRQKSNITGRTDEVYFTPSDTRIKGYLSRKRTNQPTLEVSKSYTGSYADRLCNFSSTNRFNYNGSELALIPSVIYDEEYGWSLGYIVGKTYYNGEYYPRCGCKPSFGFTYNNYDFYMYNTTFYGYNTSPFSNSYYGNYYNSYYNSYKGYNINKYNYGTRIGLIGFPNHHTTSNESKSNNSNNKKSESSNWWNNSTGSSSSGNRNTSGNTNSSTRRR